MILVDRDVLDCPLEKLAETQVLNTWLGGRTVFTAENVANQEVK
jgi:predicted amidohydrolase YtcJ